ncbi:hypothetical protein [Tropicimonas sp. IMCC34043]|uniref:hypothetical protein n=1 Tax=Tropicimonas sp. IMCC34043 TaxID=2248760 RepID=UPI00130091B4|nr:hypothetical protein [Tropicimonas sp. IMCC34043]
MRRVTLALLLALAGLPAGIAAAQDLGELMRSGLAPGRSFENGGYWLPNDIDPAAAVEAIGFVYPIIEGAAGNFDISVGYFTRQPGSLWRLSGTVSGLYGTDPRDTLFLPDRIELTTTTLAPSDARCCPTGSTRWGIDRRTLVAQAVK